MPTVKQSINFSHELKADFELVRDPAESWTGFVHEAIRQLIVKRKRDALEALAFKAACSGDILNAASIVEKTIQISES